ncbi:VOC family protein [Brachybacterium sp. NBEC-018]|uniref:VOC family protein n=1 Tax=Brachybacterium sp. NBEC-018 TaxID=2996004 RepID=UPI002174E8EE|nr:VOC family protein [Brachybacterium sp. NBEC-018]UVY85551.1 VOC family protein [Brachybacterium sp. NBEC-018]
MTTASIAAINLDSADPRALATFWAGLLDGEIAFETPDYCAVRAGSLILGAVRIEGFEPATGSSFGGSRQMHLDITVDDLDSAEVEALALGATKDPHQPAPESHRVMRDPAGHPFCIRR